MIERVTQEQYDEPIHYNKDEWVNVVNGSEQYKVNRDGRVLSLKNCQHSNDIIMRYNLDKDGYSIVCMFGKTVRVHRIVATAFIPNPENKPCINHINGVKTDNRVENLEWCTVGENNRHAFKLGLKSQAGEKHAQAKLKDADVVDIKKRILAGETNHQIADVYSVSHKLISSIRTGGSWSHIVI